LQVSAVFEGTLVGFNTPAGVKKEKMKQEGLSTLLIDGAAVGKRFRTVVNTIEVPLTGKSFKYLFLLAARLFLSDDGWISRFDLDYCPTGTFNYTQYLHSLRKDMVAAVGEDMAPAIISDQRGSYRLCVDKPCVKFNFENLMVFQDAEVVKITRELRKV